jgi:mRNA interferase HigB
MRIIARRALREFWERHERAEQPLRAWYAEASKAAWKSPQNIKAKYRHASFFADNRVVFNIAGNRYRLVAHINFDFQIVYIKFVGTHKEYDRIDAESI